MMLHCQYWQWISERSLWRIDDQYV